MRFEREWGALRAYAAERGVRLIGDLPIYVSDAGADLAAWPELFAHGEVAGAPPDALSAQRPALGEPALRLARPPRDRVPLVASSASGARSSSSTSAASTTSAASSRTGRSRPGTRPRGTGAGGRGPGAELFAAVERELGDLPLIAEDLGHITPPVHRLRDELGLPGMVVLLWAFRRAAAATRTPSRTTVANSVAYTSTHDTDTAAGWFESLRPQERAATGLDPGEPSWSLIELAYGSRSSLAVVPAQDVLGLGSDARMNRPGVSEGNWSWQLEPGALTSALARRLRGLAERHGRLRTELG